MEKNIHSHQKGSLLALFEYIHYGKSKLTICTKSRKDNTGTTPTPTARLVGGSSMYEGRLQVFQFGAWFTMCDGFWSQHNSDVACRSVFGNG